MQRAAENDRLLWTGMLERVARASPARLRRIIYFVVTSVMLGLIMHSNNAMSGDPMHYMVIARSIAFDHDLDLGNDYNDPSSLIQVPPEIHALIGRNGILRPVHDIGLPLIAAPFFAAAYRLAEMSNQLPEWLRRRLHFNQFIALRSLTSVLMILVTAGLAVMFFDASWLITGQKAVAFVWAIIWALSPPILTHGYVFFTEVPSALVALLVFSRRDDLLGNRPLVRGLVLGLLTGFLPLLHVRNVGLMAALVLLIAWRVRRDLRRGIGFGVGLAVMAAVKVGLNLEFWGTVITTPHERLGIWPGAGPLVSEMTLRSLGLLFDGRDGMLLSAPIYLLAPAALWVLGRRSGAVVRELLFLVVTYVMFVIIPVTNVHGWRGGWSPAARFLVPIAPFLALAVPALWARRRGLRIVAALLFLQILLDAFFWEHPMQLWEGWPGPPVLLEALIGRSLAAMVPAWETLNRAVVLASLAGLGLWATLTWALVRRAQDSSSPSTVR